MTANVTIVLLFYKFNAWKHFLGPLDRSLEKQLSKKDNEYDKLSRENMATVNKFAGPLLVCLCKDACDGHDVAKVNRLSWVALQVNVLGILIN